MLQTYIQNKKVFHFTDPSKTDIHENIFTIIVGKNGSGKSRLLSSIVSEFIDTSRKDLFYNDIGFRELSFKGTLQHSGSPQKIITASTSPFDRFPLGRKFEHIVGYSYLGLRDLPSQNFGLAYMSKIISSLLESLIEDSKQMKGITSVLNYLGYNNGIQIRIEPRLGNRLAYEISKSSNTDSVQVFEEIFNKRSIGPVVPINKRFFYHPDGTVDENKVDLLIETIREWYPIRSRKHIHIDIGEAGISSEELLNIPLRQLIFLMHSGILRLREVNLSKINTNKLYSIIDASSGEQSVVMGFLGIASQIKDNCLICIDEPEICLHPEWQEKYIKLLLDTFKHYKGCHFLIATHSPQIISNLDTNNCFVLSMDTGKITNADSLINNSIDFQLANVFKSPGFKNEYLSRIALSIFTKVSSKKQFDNKDTDNYAILVSQENYLDKEDPVYTLLLAIKKLYKLYARN